MSRSTTFSSACLLLPLAAACSLARAEDKSPLHFSLEAGAAYDSNVNIADLDNNSQRADNATLINANVNGDWHMGSRLQFKAGIAYSDTAHQEFEQFDVTTQRWFADVSFDATLLTLGVNTHVADAKLDSEPFLDLRLRSLYASRLFNQTLFVRYAHNERDKTFDIDSARNADGRSQDLDLFFFFDEGRRYFSLSGSRENETANDAQYSFDGVGYKARWSTAIETGDLDSKFQIGARWGKRDYEGINPLIDTTRFDRFRVYDLQWETAFNSHFSVALKLERGDYQSNYDAADYEETVSSLLLKMAF